jgi:uncharacterized protein
VHEGGRKMIESRYNVWAERNGFSYVFNSVSGSLYRMTAGQRSAFQRYSRDGVATADLAETLAHLIAGGMLINDDVDEIDVLAKKYESGRRNDRRFNLTLVTSLGCNFDCPYCFEAKHPSIMDEDVRAQVLKMLDDRLPHIDVFGAGWFGGEPLVGKAAVFDLSDAFIERCDAHGVSYAASIVTNGYLLDEETCRGLAERRVRSAQVGLDGPPEIHNVMRPLISGRGTFERILENLKIAVDYLNVGVRVNVDARNFDKVEALFEILAGEGLSGRLGVSAGHIVGSATNLLSPSANYGGCLSRPQFARVERDFYTLAEKFGFGSPSLPRQISTPCTAVRRNELVVGSRGELYKCWESVGDPKEVIGHIGEYADADSRMGKWMSYDPFTDADCTSCIALPTCMGGCAQHAFDQAQHENRCSTFRYTFHDQIGHYIDAAEAREMSEPVQIGRLGPRTAL